MNCHWKSPRLFPNTATSKQHQFTSFITTIRSKLFKQFRSEYHHHLALSFPLSLFPIPPQSRSYAFSAFSQNKLINIHFVFFFFSFYKWLSSSVTRFKYQQQWWTRFFSILCRSMCVCVFVCQCVCVWVCVSVILLQNGRVFVIMVYSVRSMKLPYWQKNKDHSFLRQKSVTEFVGFDNFIPKTS